jgi:hypothetical protein
MPSGHTADSTFAPDVDAIFKALTETCAALQAKERGDREVIAARILDLALSGVTDSSALRARVLLEARPRNGSVFAPGRPKTNRPAETGRLLP